MVNMTTGSILTASTESTTPGANTGVTTSPRRVLITGGAGFLGINLCRHLLAQGHTLRSMDIAPFDYPERGRVEVLQADIRDATAVEAAMADVDMVVHAAAALPLAPPAEIFSTEIDGTRLLLDAALRHRVQRFVYISSTSVYGIPDHHPIREDERLQGVGPYGESKIAAEKLCLSYRERGLCTPILRPKSFVGPERLGAFELLYDWACEARNFPVLGRGDNLYQLMDVEDLCVAIELSMTRDAALANDTFNVAAKDFGSMRDNFQCVLDRAGYGGRVIGLPLGPAIAALRLLEALHLSPLYRWIYETAGQDSFVSIDRIEQRLGFEPRYSNRDALVRNYDWYVAHRAEYQGISGVSHRVPWKKGALEIAKWFF